MSERISKFVDWVVVSDGRAQFIGKVEDDADGVLTLCPAFEWLCPASVDPRTGTVQRGRLALPLETFASLDTVRVRPASVVPLDGLTAVEAAELQTVLERRASLAAAPPRILVPSPVLKQ